MRAADVEEFFIDSFAETGSGANEKKATQPSGKKKGGKRGCKAEARSSSRSRSPPARKRLSNRERRLQKAAAKMQKEQESAARKSKAGRGRNGKVKTRPAVVDDSAAGLAQDLGALQI